MDEEAHEGNRAIRAKREIPSGSAGFAHPYSVSTAVTKEVFP